MKTTHLLAVVVALMVAVLTGCHSPDKTSSTAPAQGADEEVDPIEWTSEEMQSLLGCSSERLGYLLTEERLNTFADNEDGIINTEAEWEDMRVARAQIQCQLELYPEKYDETGDVYEMTYMFAYALDTNGKQVQDPLAPWPGKDNLP